MIRIGFLLQLFAIALLHTAQATDTAEPQPRTPLATASVKSLNAPSTTAAPQPADADMMMQPTPPPATLPAEHFPQYQVGYRRADSIKQALVGERQIPFVIMEQHLLNQMGRPLLVRATISIDGQPFAEVRKRQAETLLSAASQPASLPAPRTDGSADDENPTQAEEPSAASETSEGADEESDEPEPESEKPSVAPATVPVYTMTTDPEEVLRRYRAAVGQDIGDAEAEWLVTHWTDGPSLLVLHPYFQSFRADQRPAFQVVDRNRDGTVSAEELSLAAESFSKCDTNRDEVVDVREIANAADASRDPLSKSFASEPLFYLLSDLVGIHADPALQNGKLSFFDTDQDGQIQEREIVEWANRPADIELSVEFGGAAEEASKIDLLHVAEDLQAIVRLTQQGDGVDVLIGQSTINFSAVQSSSAQDQSGQVSLGAIVDGYPLLPTLDPNDDGRFTIRELRELTDRLGQYDRDGDQTLTLVETQAPLRVCIGLGPTVHRELANIRTNRRTTAPTVVVGPDWFIRMDRNQDNDLTRGEFPGTDEQFQALDADGDRLVSAGEASEFEKRSNENRE